MNRGENRMKKDNRTRAIKVFLFLLIFIVLERGIGLMLMNLKTDENRIINGQMWDEFYKMDKNEIDILFQGSSKARFAYNPVLFDKELNVTSFNFSTPLQTPKVSYYALKQALETQTPKLLVYDIYWNTFGLKHDTMPAFYVFDSIKNPLLKYGLMLSTVEDDEFASFFLQKISTTYRYRGNVNVLISNVISAIKKISGVAIVQKKPVNSEDYKYSNKGFFYSDKVFEIDKFNFNQPPSNFEWDDEQFEYFEKIIELCKSKKIKMVMVAAPIPKPIVEYLKRYDEFSARFQYIADKNKIEYIDLNVINSKLNFIGNEDFMDSGHANQNGSIKIAKILIPLLKKQIQ